MEKEKIEKPSLALEKCEQPEEIQRLELDPEKGIDIVIKKIPGRYLKYKEEVRTKKDFKGEVAVLVRTMPMKYFPAQVILEKNEEAIETFQKRSPSSPRFYFREQDPEGIEDAWSCFETKKRITMPHKWESNKDILALVHEIGHKDYALDHPEELEEQDRLDEQEEEAMLQLRSIKKRGAFFHREKPGEVPDLKPATKKDTEYFTNKLKDIKEKIISLRAREERGSWARGLNLARKLKRGKGIDLIKPFRGETPKETRENLDKYIHKLSGLGNYEHTLRNKIKKLGLSEELKGIFTKRYKEEIEKESEKTSKEVSEEASKI